MGKLNVGKTQRTRKHKKLKSVDPFCRGTRRQAYKNKMGVNERPSNPDEQEIPYRLREMMETGLKKRKKKRRFGREDTEGATREVKPVPKFQQGKRETERDFFQRMEIEGQKAMNVAKYEEKYRVEVEQKDGKITVKKDKSEGKRKRRQEHDQKRKEKKLSKKGKNLTGFERLQDSVTFGEVAQAPPELTAKPRKSDLKSNRPGKKSLLLHDIMKANKAQNPGAADSTAKSRQVGEVTKRKHMSMAQQVIMDAERDRAIELYRKMKNKSALLDIS